MDSCVSYDQRFRADLAVCQSFDYGKVHKDMYTTILESTAEQSDIRKCHRCRSIEREVVECPFPQTTPLQQEKTKAGGTINVLTEKWYHQGR